MLRSIVRTSRQWFPYAFLLLSAVLTLTEGASAQRRDFAANYKLSKIVVSGNEVSLTLALTIHNFSGAEITDAGAVLYPAGPHSGPIGVFDLIKSFPSYRDVTTIHRFTITKAEYARWKQGQEPRVVFLKPDGEGGTTSESVDLHRAMIWTDQGQ